MAVQLCNEVRVAVANGKKKAWRQRLLDIAIWLRGVIYDIAGHSAGLVKVSPPRRSDMTAKDVDLILQHMSTGEKEESDDL